MAEVSAAVIASGEDSGPGSIEEDVGDAGIAMKQDGDAAREGLDGGDSVTLDGGHDEEMGLVVELLEVPIGDEAVELDRVAETELRGKFGECGELRASAGEVDTPVCPRAERGSGVLQLGEGVENPVDALIGLDAADREQTKRAAGLDGPDSEEAGG
jgi:hypothetical protein